MIKALTVSIALSWIVGAVSVASAETPLDIVGIKVGMSLPQALEALKAHNIMFRIRPRQEQNNSKDPTLCEARDGTTVQRIGGIPQFTGLVICKYLAGSLSPYRSELESTDLTAEEISVEALPTPSSPEVVTGISRVVQWKPGKERAVTTLLASLKQKYGDHMTLVRVANSLTAIWHYDSTGKPIQRPPSCSSEDIAVGRTTQTGGPRPEVYVMGNTASVLMDRLAAVARACGSFVTARFLEGLGNSSITNAITIIAANDTLLAARMSTLRQSALSYADDYRKKETGTATKRGEKF
jgi:hypothetical protein